MALRVLLVNKFYYNRGGDCLVTLGTESLLRGLGCEVAVFAMQYPQNLASPWSGYFAPQIDFGGNRLKALQRTMGWGDVKTSFQRLLNDFKPDVVHLHNIHSYLSPVVAQLARRQGRRVVWTLHDHKLLCPSYLCLREGKICTECFTRKSAVLRHRCMKGSLAASALAWLEALRWNRRTLEACTDVFICPSQFMAANMRKGGFDPQKLTVLNNFIDPEKLDWLKATSTQPREDSCCYVGRLSQEKGVATLLQVAASTGLQMRVAGTGPLEKQLRQAYASHPNIQFLGQLGTPEVCQLLSRSRLSFTPSECYENNPLGVIESLCAGTPVVGSDLGGIPELLSPATGVTFAAGNARALEDAISQALHQPWDHAAIAREAHTRFAPGTYVQQLMKIYQGTASPAPHP